MIPGGLSFRTRLAGNSRDYPVRGIQPGNLARSHQFPTSSRGPTNLDMSIDSSVAASGASSARGRERIFVAEDG